MTPYTGLPVVTNTEPPVLCCHEVVSCLLFNSFGSLLDIAILTIAMETPIQIIADIRRRNAVIFLGLKFKRKAFVINIIMCQRAIPEMNPPTTIKIPHCQSNWIFSDDKITNPLPITNIQKLKQAIILLSIGYLYRDGSRPGNKSLITFAIIKFPSTQIASYGALSK